MVHQFFFFLREANLNEASNVFPKYLLRIFVKKRLYKYLGKMFPKGHKGHPQRVLKLFILKLLNLVYRINF